MNHQTPFLVALGLLTLSAFVVGVTGWILFARDHAARRLGLSSAAAGTGDAGSSATEVASAGSETQPPAAPTTETAPTGISDDHHEVAEGS
jgi:hypothetical protein